MGGPVYGVAWAFDVELPDLATQGKFLAAPPLATGDFKLKKDDGAYVNLATLPVVDPAGSKTVHVVLSATEMQFTRGKLLASDPDNVWGDISWEIQTDSVAVDTTVASRASQTSVDDLPTNAELTTALAGADDAVLAAIAALNNLAAGAAMTLTSGERDAIAAALLDLANSIETGLTVRQAMRLGAAADAGKVAGMATTAVTIRNAVADTKTRITATVDTVGNRTAITTDVT